MSKADPHRGTGRTTRLIQSAPRGAVYVWMSARTDYPSALAAKLGRDDLVFVSPDWLTTGKWNGLELTGIVKDHAVRFTDEQWEAYNYALPRVRRMG